MKITKKNIITSASLALMQLIAPIGSVLAEDNTNDTKNQNLSYSFFEGAYVHNNFNSNGLVISDRDGVGNTADDNFGTLSDSTGNGAAFRASFQLPTKNDKLGLHFVADYLGTTHHPGINLIGLEGAVASGSLNTKQQELRLALGLHGYISPKASLFFELGMVNSKVTFSSANLQVSGGGAVTADLGSASGSATTLDGKIGLRFMASERLELNAYGRYNGTGSLMTAVDGSSVGFSSKWLGGAGSLLHVNNRLAIGGDYEFGKPGRLRLLARVKF